MTTTGDNIVKGIIWLISGATFSRDAAEELVREILKRSPPAPPRVLTRNPVSDAATQFAAEHGGPDMDQETLARMLDTFAMRNRVDEAFHGLAVHERDHAWRTITDLRKQLDAQSMARQDEETRHEQTKAKLRRAEKACKAARALANHDRIQDAREGVAPCVERDELEGALAEWEKGRKP